MCGERFRTLGPLVFTHLSHRLKIRYCHHMMSAAHSQSFVCFKQHLLNHKVDCHQTSQEGLLGGLLSKIVQRIPLTPNTRGIWKVLSIGFYLSNRFTNPIMFGIIFKSYLSSVSSGYYNAETNNNIVNTCPVCILENAKFQCKIYQFTF